MWQIITEMPVAKSNFRMRHDCFNSNSNLCVTASPQSPHEEKGAMDGGRTVSMASLALMLVGQIHNKTVSKQQLGLFI